MSRPATLCAAALVAALLALALLGCAGGVEEGDRPEDLSVVPADCPPAPRKRAPATTPGTIAVTERPAQVMDGWGASVVGDTFVDPLVNPVGLRREQLRALDRLVFRRAGIDIVRVFGPGYGRARVTATAAQRRRDLSFAFMRRVAPYGVRFMYTGTRAPAALRDGIRLRRGAEAAYGRSVAAYLRFARDALGLPFDYAALANEPDNRKALLVMTPQQATKASRALALQLALDGQGTLLVAGDTTGWGTACPYIRAQLRSALVRANVAAVASHPYRGTDAEAASLAAQARKLRLPVWQTEWGTGCATCPEDNSMHLAIRWSRRIATDLTRARTSAWFTFRAVADSTHGPGDALIVRQRRDRRAPWLVTRRFHVFRQYSSVAPRGAQRLEVRDGVRGVLAVAFRDGERTSLVLTNTSRRSARPVRLDLGRGRGTLSARRTSATASFAPLPSARYRGRPLAVELPPESVTTYTVSAAG